MSRRFEKLPNNHAARVLAKHPHELGVTPPGHQHSKRGCVCERIDKDVWLSNKIVRPKLGLRARLLSALQASGKPKR